MNTIEVDLPATLHGRIDKAILLSGKTVVQISAITGLTFVTISNARRKKIPAIRFNTVALIAKATNQPLDFFKIEENG